MNRRRPAAWPLGLLGALLVMPVLVIVLGRAENPGSSSSAVAAPSATGMHAAEPITGIDQAVWWRLGWRARGDDAPPQWDRLTIGRVDGEIFGHVRVGVGGTMPGAGPPFVVGPRMGMILYGVATGRAAELHVFDSTVGEDRTLVTSSSLLHYAALAPMSGYAYFATGAPNPGIWRVALDGSSNVPELVAEPPEVVGARADAVLTAPIDQLPKQVTLMLDRSERWLAVFTCTDSCFLRVFDLRNDEELEVPGLDPGSRVLTDFVDGVVVIEGGSAFDIESARAVAPPDDADTAFHYQVGWEVPPGWRIEERLNGMGPTHFVLTDPDGNETSVDAMGEGVGNG